MRASSRDAHCSRSPYRAGYLRHSASAPESLCHTMPRKQSGTPSRARSCARARASAARAPAVAVRGSADAPEAKGGGSRGRWRALTTAGAHGSGRQAPASALAPAAAACRSTRQPSSSRGAPAVSTTRRPWGSVTYRACSAPAAEAASLPAKSRRSTTDARLNQGCCSQSASRGQGWTQLRKERGKPQQYPRGRARAIRSVVQKKVRAFQDLPARCCVTRGNLCAVRIMRLWRQKAASEGHQHDKKSQIKSR